MTVLEVELMDIKARLARLEAMVTRLADQPAGPVRSTPKRKQPVTPLAAEEPMTPEELIARLKADGVIRDLTPDERKLAAEWDALPEEEKEAVRTALDNLPPGPMVSDIIIDNRR